ncbi:MAG: alpha/beta hydrolase, partial [Nanoarchaeota archaeon]|nr:alpha/beta hydrolase [Nanoarchaeota archaeon]
PYFEKIDENTVFIGRSIGPPFILRVLELLNKPVKASFLVAGFCSDIGLKEFRPVLDTFIDKPFNWNKIRANCQKFIVYHSVDDPIVPLKNGEELAEKLGVKLRVFEDGGHFNIGTMYGLKFEEILEDVKELL